MSRSDRDPGELSRSDRGPGERSRSDRDPGERPADRDTDKSPVGVDRRGLSGDFVPSERPAGVDQRGLSGDFVPSERPAGLDRRGQPAEFDQGELPSDLDAHERMALGATAARLVAARPLPSPGFRGDLRREMLARAGPLARRPPRLRRRVAAFLVAGAIPMIAAGTGLTGSGPFAPPADGAGRAAPGLTTAAPSPAPPARGSVHTAQIR